MGKNHIIIAIVAFTLLTTISILYYFSPELTAKANAMLERKFKSLFRQAISHQEISQKIELIQGRLKSTGPLLIVGTQNIDIFMEQRSKKELFGINLGDSACSLKATNNSIQYVANLSAVSFNYKGNNELEVNLPRPYINESAIAINPDYKLDCTIGWARHKNYSGAFLKKKLKETLKKSILIEARKQATGYQEIAESNFQEKMRQIVHQFFPAHEEIHINFRYKKKAPL